MITLRILPVTVAGVKKSSVAVVVLATVEDCGNVIVKVLGLTAILTAVIFEPFGIVPAVSKTKSPTVIVPVKLAVGTLPVMVVAPVAPFKVAVALVLADVALFAAMLS